MAASSPPDLPAGCGGGHAGAGANAVGSAAASAAGEGLTLEPSPDRGPDVLPHPSLSYPSCSGALGLAGWVF